MTRIVLVCALLVSMGSTSLVQAADLPLYCQAFAKFERTCTGVKAAVAALGASRAQRWAKACGASEIELQQARDCLLPKPQTCPPEWKCNGKRDTNDPSCYAPACQS
jgi:hypothetical protein